MIPFLVLALSTLCSGQLELGSYNIDLNSWSISGISSGACFSAQMHVAYASDVMGVGMVAGCPYYCSRGATAASLRCMDTPSQTSIPTLIQDAEDFAAAGDNDPTGFLSNSKVFIYQGSQDSVVYPENGPLNQQFYNYFFADVLTEFGVAAEHGFPTNDYGGPCAAQDPEYINNCGYDGAFQILNHMYGGLTDPGLGGTHTGDFYTFNQDDRDFFETSIPSFWSMDDIGYVYVPTGCTSGIQICKLHVVMHGCSQGSYAIGTNFAINTGYLEVAEANNIVLLFPQAISSFANPVNGFGCWDWWGYNTFRFANKGGGQPLAIHRMMQKVSGLL